MTHDTRITNADMARRKQFSDRSTLAFLPGTFAKITGLTAEGEDKSDFIRAAVELALAIRRLDVYAELPGYLLTDETLEEFCARAVRRAVLQRKAAIAEMRKDGSEAPNDPAA